MNAVDSNSTGGAGEAMRPGGPPTSSLEGIAGLPHERQEAGPDAGRMPAPRCSSPGRQGSALRLEAHDGARPELLRALNRSLAGPCQWGGAKTDQGLGVGLRLGLGVGVGAGLGLEAKRERFERESCGVLIEWLRDAKEGEIAEKPMSNAEKIALLRQVVFADVDDLERSGEIVLPD